MYEPAGRGNITFHMAPMQADPCITKLAVNSTANSCATDDGDFHMYIGTAGCDLIIKEISGITKSNPGVSFSRLSTGENCR